MPKKDQGVYLNFFKKPIKPRKFTGYMCSFDSSGNPVFNFFQDTEQLIERINLIHDLFKDDGVFNPNSPIAEEYAFCLAKDGKNRAAAELFEKIIGFGHAGIILAINESPDFRGWICSPIVNKFGKLGYHGALCCARLFLKDSDKYPERELVGLELLSEIATKIPGDCVPFGLQSVLIEALRILIKHKIKVPNMDLAKKLDYVRERHYAEV